STRQQRRGGPRRRVPAASWRLRWKVLPPYAFKIDQREYRLNALTRPRISPKVSLARIVFGYACCERLSQCTTPHRVFAGCQERESDRRANPARDCEWLRPLGVQETDSDLTRSGRACRRGSDP